MPKKIEISHRTIIFTFIFLLTLWLLYYIRDILIAVFVALIIMAVLNPMVTKLSRYKIPRSLSVILTYLLLLLVVSFAIAAIVPPLVTETSGFVTNFPGLLENIGVSSYLSDQVLGQLINQLGTLPAGIAKATVSLFSNILGIVTIFVFAFYLLTDRHKFDDQLASLLGDTRAKVAAHTISELEMRLGGWARAQLSLMIIIGVFTYIGLRLLEIPFALPLAILAGILEIVPYAGPIISAVPAVIIGLGISPVIGVATAALFFLVQQLENYLFVPKIMQRSVGVNPIVTLLSLAIGFRLAGVLGLLISVPVYLTIQVIALHYFTAKEVSFKI